MNEKQSFIIEDLDDFHVVIKADEEYRVRRELEAEVRLRPMTALNALLRRYDSLQLEKNTYSLE